MTLPVSVIIVTKNEEKDLAACLKSLSCFDEVVVVDSFSQDKTRQIAGSFDCTIVDFKWDGKYPKKRQWCLDNLNLKHDWILFIDADERVTNNFIGELKNLFSQPLGSAGYFVKGWHVLNGKVLRHGLQNNKIALLNRNKMEFPVIDDLDIPGMGEIEGHYQPVLKSQFLDESIGQLKSALLHYAMEDPRAWIFRHQKYARWEKGMNEKSAWPKDPRNSHEKIKNYLRSHSYRPQFVFFLSYIALLGFLDGREGFRFARYKREYYNLIQK